MNVKTTKIEKKYKDKKTGEYKSLTIEHAKVKDRLKAFWEGNPKGSILTDRVKDANTIEFVTNIVADQSNEFSRKARGHAMANLPLGDKDYEKLETISVGRALALLGYATDGEVASFEEMEDFLSEKEAKKLANLQEVSEKLATIDTIEELRVYFKEIEGQGKEVVDLLMAKSKELKNVK